MTEPTDAQCSDHAVVADTESEISFAAWHPQLAAKRPSAALHPMAAPGTSSRLRRSPWWPDQPCVNGKCQATTIRPAVWSMRQLPNDYDYGTGKVASDD